MFRGPEQAYNSLDFHGNGYIVESDILQSPVMIRLAYSKQDSQLCFKLLNLFNNVSAVSALKDGVPPHGMPYDRFREVFFPHLHILKEENQSDDEKADRSAKREFAANGDQWKKAVQGKIEDLETYVKEKISRNYFQVNKAFRAFDKDFDGYVTVEDFMHFFGTDGTIDYDELKRLIYEKDSTKTGKLGYTDFSKWFGSAIHQLAGFYFRHDSKQNPQFDAHQRAQKQKFPASDGAACRAGYNDNLAEKVLRKMYE
jgi:hypothetical protein